MVKRKKLDKRSSGGLYFKSQPVEFFSTGCTTLDLALGGGIAEGRVMNIVGDKSTGKTLLAIEAAANFHKKHPTAEIHYAEAEAAFDKPYAATMGLPLEAVRFVGEDEDGSFGVDTVEDVFNDIERVISKLKKNQPALYILDSLDALSDIAELKRKIDEGTYGTKAAQIGKLFRKLVRKMKRKRLTLIIVSQIRDNIGVVYGKQHKRSGGRALDFYATHVVWLTHINRLTRTRKKVKRAVGVNVQAAVEKNKVGPPFRSCMFPIIFSYGIEDSVACVNFLNDTGQLKSVGLTKKKVTSNTLLNRLDGMNQKQYRKFHKRLVKHTRRVWADVEESFSPVRNKY